MSIVRNQWFWAVVVFLSAELTGQFIHHAPTHYRVVRATTIRAPASVVFAHVADFNKWAQWSPWAKLDSNSKMNVVGQPQRVGHRQEWDGEVAGKGHQTIVAIDASRSMRTQLNFTAPFAATPTSEFVLTPADGGAATVVEWDLRGDNSLVTRIFMTLLFINMEVALGAEYDEGLRNLKALCERSVA